MSESEFCFRSPTWVFSNAHAKKSSEMAMASMEGEDLDGPDKQQNVLHVVLLSFVRLYTSTRSQSLHQLLQGLY